MRNLTLPWRQQIFAAYFINFPELPHLELAISDDQFQKLLFAENFDKDGYELNALEQAYHIANGVPLSNHLGHCSCSQPWIIQLKDHGYIKLDRGCIRLDHSFCSVRYSYRGAAREQLETNLQHNPNLAKLLNIRAKYGLDVSIDFVSPNMCFELLHIEVDEFEIGEIYKTIDILENRILKFDFLAFADKLNECRSVWYSLSSDKQSDYKAHLFGWNQAFENLKVFRPSLN